MRAPNLLMILSLGSLLAYACVGCPPHPLPVAPDGSQDASGDVQAPEPPADAVDASTGLQDAATDALDDPDGNVDAARYASCAKACANLGKLGCPEAATVDGGDSCYAVCAHAVTSHKFDFKAACLTAAKSAAEAKACGSVRCARP